MELHSEPVAEEVRRQHEELQSAMFEMHEVQPSALTIEGLDRGDDASARRPSRRKSAGRTTKLKPPCRS